VANKRPLINWNNTKTYGMESIQAESFHCKGLDLFML
jgi:hypothetical protein